MLQGGSFSLVSGPLFNVGVNITSSALSLFALDYCSVPTGIAIFPAEIYKFPRSWLGNHYNIQRFTLMKSGGHFNGCYFLFPSSYLSVSAPCNLLSC